MLSLTYEIESGFPKAEHGIYVVHQITAYERDQIGEKMAIEDPEYPEKMLTPKMNSEWNARLIEAATKKDGKQFKVDRKKISSKLWELLLYATIKLNTISEHETHFLHKKSLPTETDSEEANR